MENTVLVSTTGQIDGRHTYKNNEQQENIDIALQPQQDSFIISQTPTSWMSFVREAFTAQGVTGKPLDIICNSWTQGTQKQYSSHISAWLKFYQENMDHPMKPNLQQALVFLARQSNKVGHNSVAAAQSALSSFIILDGKKLGEHPIISRFMSGLFNLKPVFPRYAETWNTQIVLEHLMAHPPAEEMSLKQLTLTLTMLIALITAQQTQTIHLLNLDDVSTYPDQCVFKVTLLKQNSISGRHLVPIVLYSYPTNDKLHVVTVLKEYIKRTAQIRKKPQLLLCHVSPYGPASKDTIVRWIKQVMTEAGIDTNVFKAHSTRSVSTSAAKLVAVPIQDVLDAAGWCSDSVFGKYYNKPIQKNSNSYAQAILTFQKKMLLSCFDVFMHLPFIGQ